MNPDSITNELQVMNLLNHVNLIQLYDAFESKNEMILVMEYVGGGELFEKIVDESYRLTELDAMVYVKQICQGIHYMHQMYVLHLDLKPENILCVDSHGNQVKIIDFGLARRYKPREKLRVSFGTPEFLAPEIVNFEHVSFPTDMWSLGVVTYMLLSGLSPFLGDTDAETLSNILTTNCSFDDEAFENISEEAKDFIANLLIREKSGRLSASQCLKHPWLNDIAAKTRHCNVQLKSQLLLKKYVMKRLWKGKTRLCDHPHLFTIYLTLIVHLIRNDLPPGVSIRHHLDRKLPDLGHFRAETKLTTMDIHELQFAADCCAMAHSVQDMQKMLDLFNASYKRLCLSLNITKMKVLHQPFPGQLGIPCTIHVDGVALEYVQHTPYLSSHLSQGTTIDEDVQLQVNCADAAFFKLCQCVFVNSQPRFWFIRLLC
ncbi:myosin light chain kinase family member 4-like [Carcharodon carcharias]|uniref:myosin light chain kinase family member 4-like n=1 Tax=Carcharodon carcharias TaxID=13397 RepID=UPI001B7E28DB|nr:myosin light chain kinase family member 4-like [Carcharodon carcharias]